jgi:hypothetical protein
MSMQSIMIKTHLVGSIVRSMHPAIDNRFDVCSFDYRECLPQEDQGATSWAIFRQLIQWYHGIPRNAPSS